MTKEQNIKQLPKDWKWVKLGEVCGIVYGKGLPTKNLKKEGFPVFGANGIIGFNDNYLYEESMVLISCRGAYSGKINFSPSKCYVTNNSLVLDVIRKKELDKNYLFYSLVAAKKNRLVTGTAQPQVTINNAVELEIPLPPKPTQQAIVSKIEELFSELDKGIENLRLAQQQLKTYRQSVLKWAFVNNSFKDYILKDISEKIQIGPFGTQLHKEDYIENGIPLINPMHIKDGYIVADNSYSIKKEKRDSLPNYILKEGDIVMGRRGEMGRCGLVTKKEEGWFCGTGSLYFRPNRKNVNSVFLYYYLRSELVKKYLDDNAGGTTMANLNLKIVNEIPISLPSIEQQNKIVQEIESRLSVADKMEESITQSLQQTEALRQSILKKAFEGRLI